MKRKDAFVQILHEITGQSKEELSCILDEFASMKLGDNVFEEEISDAEYENMLSGFREQKDIIKKWFLDSQAKMILRDMEPQGHA